MEKEIFLPLVLVIFAAVITLGYVFVLFRRVSRVAINDKKVEDIHNHIHEGAMTFLVREYKKSRESKSTPNCREKCAGCGANRLGGVTAWCPKASE